MPNNYILTSNGSFMSDEDYLQHWAGSSKGKERSNHKYTARYWKNGQWVYVYDQNKLDSNSKRINRSVAEARSEMGKYNSGYYFDKDHPGNMAAEKQQANMRYQRLRADAVRADNAAKQNKKNTAEYNKSIFSKIDKGKNWFNLFKRRLGLR